MLEIRSLYVSHGSLEAVRDVSLNVERGEVVALLGVNGSGKSSILEAVSGLKRLVTGEIFFDGIAIQHEPAHRNFARGIVQVPHERLVLTRLTVAENLVLGTCRAQRTASCMGDVLADFPDIAARLGDSARSLSGGQQQLLAIARALMARPTLLLLDEPTLGLSPIATARVFDIIATLKNRGMGVLLVDQNVNRALAIADRGYVLDCGRIVLQGRSSDLLTEQQLAEVTIGTLRGRKVA